MVVLGTEAVAEMRYFCIHEGTVTTTGISITEEHWFKQQEKVN
jgi:hypothetical protein